MPNLGAIGSNTIFCEISLVTVPQAPISATRKIMRFIKETILLVPLLLDLTKFQKGFGFSFSVRLEASFQYMNITVLMYVLLHICNLASQLSFHR